MNDFVSKSKECVMKCGLADDCYECSFAGVMYCDSPGRWDSGADYDLDNSVPVDKYFSPTEVEVQKKFCVTCGERVGESWKFCMKCGAAIPEELHAENKEKCTAGESQVEDCDQYEDDCDDNYVEWDYEQRIHRECEVMDWRDYVEKDVWEGMFTPEERALAGGYD